MHRLYSERGSAALMAAIAMVLLGGIGATTVSLVSTKESTRTDAVASEQASALAQAGIEYAKNRIDMGLSPAVSNYAMGVGAFTVATIPSSGTVTSTGAVGAATKTYSLTTDFGKNNVNLNTSEAKIGQATTQTSQTCPAGQTLTAVCYDTKGQGKTKDMETTEVCSGDLGTFTYSYTQGACAGDNWGAATKVTICHIPPGNPANAHTITVGAAAQTAHLAHGDTLGACGAANTNVVSNLDTIYGVKITNAGGLDYVMISDWTAAWNPNALEKTTQMTATKTNQTTTLYNNTPGYASGAQINSTDYQLASADTDLPLTVKFNTTLTAGKTYTLTMHFADGSTVAKSFTPTITTVSNNPPPPADPTPGYDVESDGDVVVEAGKTVSLTVICKEITYGAGGPAVDVRAALGVNGVYTPMFGNQPVTGGKTDTTSVGNSAKTFTVRGDARYPATGRAIYSASYNSKSTLQVKTLINGNTPPPLNGFGGQKPVTACLAPYLNQQTGKVVLLPSQVILLLELGVNMRGNPNSTAADFQDLVVLMGIN